MSLSKPIYSLLGAYLEQLFNHPLRTKSITSSFLAASANYTAQRIGGQKKINKDSLFAYGLFGLIFGGSVPHYFYQTVERLFSEDLRFRKLYQFLSERLVFAPLYQLLSLYFLSRFEWNSHNVAVTNLEKMYWSLLSANWQYLSIFIFLNMFYVPPMLRSLFMSSVSFAWIVYIAIKRRRLQEQRTQDSTSKSQ